MSGLVHLERRDDGVAVVRLDNPKVNALSKAVLRELTTVAEGLRDDPPGAVVVTGGDRIFAAGAEISEFRSAEVPDEVITRAEAELIGQLFLRALNAVADIPRATIAAISGFALGGGCELALACDFRIASEKARLGQPEILLGIIPGGGGTQRLARLVGPSRAKDLIFTGRQVRADEALAMGLVDEVVAPEAVLDRALERAAALAAGATKAQGLAKRAIDRGLDITLERRPRPRAAAVRRRLPHRGRGHRRAVVPRARPRQRHLQGALSEPGGSIGPGDLAELDRVLERRVGGDDPHGDAVATGLLAGEAAAVAQVAVVGGAGRLERHHLGRGELLSLAGGTVEQLHLHVVGTEVAERDDRLDQPLGAEVGQRVVELDVVDVHAGPGRVDLGLPAGQLPGGGVAVGAEQRRPGRRWARRAARCSRAPCGRR